jgi:flagellar biosynthetic protein FliQ
MMDAEYFLTVAREAMWVLALASAPILIPALLSGLILGMVQAATSIQEQTLTFVPKLAIVGVSLVIFGGMIMTLLGDFTRASSNVSPSSFARSCSASASRSSLSSGRCCSRWCVSAPRSWRRRCSARCRCR